MNTNLSTLPTSALIAELKAIQDELKRRKTCSCGSPVAFLDDKPYCLMTGEWVDICEKR